MRCAVHRSAQEDAARRGRRPRRPRRRRSQRAGSQLADARLMRAHGPGTKPMAGGCSRRPIAVQGQPGAPLDVEPPSSVGSRTLRGGVGHERQFDNGEHGEHRPKMQADQRKTAEDEIVIAGGGRCTAVREYDDRRRAAAYRHRHRLRASAPSQGEEHVLERRPHCVKSTPPIGGHASQSAATARRCAHSIMGCLRRGRPDQRPPHRRCARVLHLLNAVLLRFEEARQYFASATVMDRSTPAYRRMHKPADVHRTARLTLP